MLGVWMFWISLLAGFFLAPSFDIGSACLDSEVPQPMVVQKEVEVPVVEYVDQADSFHTLNY